MLLLSSSSKRENGQGLVEYALILVLVAIVVIGALMVLGPIIGSTFSTINASLPGGGVSAGGSPTSVPAGCTVKHADGYATGPGYPYPCYSPSLGGGYYP